MLAIYLQMIPDEREHAKFERVYHKYKNLMFHCAKEILGNDEDVEDTVHMSLEAIAKNSKISDVYCTETRNFIVIIVERKAIERKGCERKVEAVTRAVIRFIDEYCNNRN